MVVTAGSVLIREVSLIQSVLYEEVPLLFGLSLPHTHSCPISDNGAWMEKGLDGGSNGLLRGEKGATWEGGLRYVLRLRLLYPTEYWCGGGDVCGGVWCGGVWCDEVKCVVLWCNVSYGVG